MMNSDVKRVVVKYNTHTVGYLASTDNDDIFFQYDLEWIAHGFSISPFSLPLDSKVYQYFVGLYGVFYDSLPDGWGDFLVRRMLRTKGINFDKLSPLTRLTLIGKNGLGGLVYEPDQKYEDIKADQDLDELSNEVDKILADQNYVPDLDFIFAYGGASGGARPKAHLILNHEEWIVKFPSMMDSKDSGLMEYNTNKLAYQSGIHVNEFKLFPSKKCAGYFGAKRFDRTKNGRVHMISLAGLLETTHRIPNLDYGHLFQVIQKICVDKSDLYEAYRRMCFNVLFQNKDDHGKNFSFLYDEQKKGYVLSPAYDMTQTLDKLEHEMTVLGNANPNEKDLLNFAKEMNLSVHVCEDIIAQIKEQIINR